MRARPSLLALPALVLSFLLVAPATALAQVVAPPPTRDDLKPGHPWSFLMMKGLAAVAALSVVVIAVAYVVKARDFRANQRKGGTK